MHRASLPAPPPSNAALSRGGRGDSPRSPPYTARALGLAAAWVVSALPAALGVTRCPSARLFHFACPGCGLTRASYLLLHGEVGASVAMHPLAAPIILATALVALGTVVATYTHGTPTAMVERRAGRAVLVLFVAVQAASLALWGMRMAGMFGGPVAV